MIQKYTNAQRERESLLQLKIIKILTDFTTLSTSLSIRKNMFKARMLKATFLLTSLFCKYITDVIVVPSS